MGSAPAARRLRPADARAEERHCRGLPRGGAWPYADCRRRRHCAGPRFSSLRALLIDHPRAAAALSRGALREPLSRPFVPRGPAGLRGGFVRDYVAARSLRR